MIRSGNFSIGLLVGFLVYVERFYSPLRQVSALWAQLQTALAAWDRISLILELMPNLVSPQITEPDSHSGTTEILSFHEVSFGYTEGQKVLSGISLSLEEGKTYALVGPTGGGKTTTASLMARLYDPVSGEIKLFGKNMKDWSNTLRAEYIGFILQDPFLFSGTVKDNIFYGNHLYGDLKSEEALSILEKEGLSELLDRFEGGLDAEVAPQSVTLSLGQKQIIAFMRAVLRKPKILILDEATANIDTLTEEILQSILLKLPKETTKVIIAHRLNTIQNADEIFFVSGGMVTNAGSFDHAVELLLHHKRTS
jgi:ATP-binding cassette subfamily B protein